MSSREILPVEDREMFDRLARFSGYQVLLSWFRGLSPHSADMPRKATVVAPDTDVVYNLASRVASFQGVVSVGFELASIPGQSVNLVGRRNVVAIDPRQCVDFDLVSGQELAWKRIGMERLELVPRHLSIQDSLPSSNKELYEPKIIRVESIGFLDVATAEALVAGVEPLLQSPPGSITQ